MSPAQRCKAPDLTVIDLAQPSASRPRPAYGVGTCPGEARRVDHQPKAFEIFAGCRRHTARPALEASTEAAVAFHESGGDSIKPLDAYMSIFK